MFIFPLERGMVLASFAHHEVQMRGNEHRLEMIYDLYSPDFSQ